METTGIPHEAGIPVTNSLDEAMAALGRMRMMEKLPANRQFQKGAFGVGGLTGRVQSSRTDKNHRS